MNGMYKLPTVEVLPPNSVLREVVVTPGMSSNPALFISQIGDWTWENVSLATNIDVFRAKDEAGNPAYFSFYYVHYMASSRIHPTCLALGDRLNVRSASFSVGSEGVLTLHAVKHAGTPLDRSSVDPRSFHKQEDGDCLYVETFNRWVKRRDPASNRGLASAAPVGYRYDLLPALPDARSLRALCPGARDSLTFRNSSDQRPVTMRAAYTTTYKTDVSRDINTVGLLYYVAYISIVDHALAEYWNHMGRSASSFLNRVILDQKICYFGNCNPGTTLTIQIASGAHQTDKIEFFDVTLSDQNADRLLVVSTIAIDTSDPELEYAP